MVLCEGCRDTLGSAREPLLGGSGDPGEGMETTLAAEAYRVDRETVSAAIDHAVEHDRLYEASGKLLE